MHVYEFLYGWYLIPQQQSPGHGRNMWAVKRTVTTDLKKNFLDWLSLDFVLSQALTHRSMYPVKSELLIFNLVLDQ